MLTLLQRFDYSLLQPQDSKRIGIYLDPAQWLDNHPPSFEINYNPEKNHIASIEVRSFHSYSTITAHWFSTMTRL